MENSENATKEAVAVKVVQAAPAAENKLLIVLMAGIVMGGGLVYGFGNYRLVGAQKYEALVAKSDAAKAAPPVVAAPVAAPPPQAPPPQQGGQGQPRSANALVGPKINFDYAGTAARGPKGAKVALTVFSDFECPACSQWAPNIENLHKTFEKNVVLRFKHLPLPFHSKAKGAAIAAEAAGAQGKFWEMHDLLFKNANSLNRETYVKHAKALGIDIERFKKDLDNPKLAARVQRDMKEADANRMPGTPTFFINGRRADVDSPNSLHQLVQTAVGG
jgi:protein-disulfide isomerase